MSAPAAGLMMAGLATASGPVAITYQANSSVASPTSPRTFASMAIGTAGSGRYVIVALCGLRSGTGTISGVTVGGVSLAQQVIKEDASHYVAEIWCGLVPSGTTANVVVTFTGTWYALTAVTYSMTGAGSATAYATGGDTDVSNPQTSSVNVPANGGVVAILGNNTGSGVTWTGPTEDVDTTDASGRGLSAASSTTSTAQTPLSISVTNPSGSTAVLAAASWGP